MAAKSSGNDGGAENPALAVSKEATDISGIPPKLVIERINQLTGQIIGQAESLRTQVQDSEIQKSLKELRDASVLFQSMADTATASVMRTPSIMANVPAATHAGAVVDQAPCRSCGGSCDGCGDEHKQKCCMQLYISGLRVIDGQGVLEGRLELVVAVQAGDTWGLAPGLSSFYSVVEGTKGLKLNDPIANICVPCNECMNIPLHVEVMEQSNGTALGALGELRLEVGTEQRVMAVRCDCDNPPVAVAVGLTKAKKTIGVVEVEISARRKFGGCC
jgi:hypothetical protein